MIDRSGSFAIFSEHIQKASVYRRERLTKVLTYHVVSGKVAAAEVVKLSSAKTVEGEEIKIDTSHGVKVNDANVIKTDIMASNGVIHVIDAVLLPE